MFIMSVIYEIPRGKGNVHQGITYHTCIYKCHLLEHLESNIHI